MRFRKLRIAWSVVWGVVAVLLILLWVRSYWWVDTVVLPVSGNRLVTLGTFSGTVGLGTATFPQSALLSFNAVPVDNVRQVWLRTKVKPPSPWLGGILTRMNAVMVFMPMWLATGAIVLVSAGPWIHWPSRFSLRTMLLTTTLVAALLGLVMWSLR